MLLFAICINSYFDYLLPAGEKHKHSVCMNPACVPLVLKYKYEHKHKSKSKYKLNIHISRKYNLNLIIDIMLI